MRTSRRDFLKICASSAAALGLTMSDLGQLEEVLANPNAPTVLWLQGCGCTGCSVSFLNHISSTSPTTAADVLINSINLAYHPTLMAAAGSTAVAAVDSAVSKGGFILVVEGGIATAFGGNAAIAWTRNGQDVTVQQAVLDLASKASNIICVGDCASWGGVSAAGSNPAGVKGVKAVTGKTTINIAGCPPHPSWIVWAITNVLLNKVGTLDSYGRPSALYSTLIHSNCPRRGNRTATTYGQDTLCMKQLGCNGPRTKSNCPSIAWNNGVNWCVDSNSQCLGCTNPDFPRSPIRPAV